MVRTDLWSTEHGRTRPTAMLVAALACMIFGLSATVSAQPTFSKIFDPGSPGAGTGRDAIGPGSTTTLRFDIGSPS